MKVQADLSRLSIRRAVRQDLPRLLELIADDDLGKNREGVGSEEACYAEAFERITADDNQFLMVAELDGRIIAMQQVTFIPGLSRKGSTRAMIESVRVDGYLRGQGIGHWFIEQAIALARERGCQLVQLTSDKKRIQAHRFYGSMGFTASHEGFKLQL
ncbi:GNAT family N-acetyltransferase [Undibacterium sp. Tian12W]|uniref:GNAT family N-acetyltransferase n=1 Tax=Undibacterium sp. Tian12W TaxID=3413054 RepID=UPI003BF2A838